MINREELDIFLKDLAGCEPPCLMVKDPGSDLSWRFWTDDDSEAMCSWLNGLAPEPEPKGVACYNAKQAAEAMGVAISTVLGLLRREKDPIPHFRSGRRLVIPVAALAEWLKEECGRTEASGS